MSLYITVRRKCTLVPGRDHFLAGHLLDESLQLLGPLLQGILYAEVTCTFAHELLAQPVGAMFRSLISNIGYLRSCSEYVLDSLSTPMSVILFSSQGLLRQGVEAHLPPRLRIKGEHPPKQVNPTTVVLSRHLPQWRVRRACAQKS